MDSLRSPLGPRSDNTADAQGRIVDDEEGKQTAKPLQVLNDIFRRWELYQFHHNPRTTLSLEVSYVREKNGSLRVSKVTLLLTSKEGKEDVNQQSISVKEEDVKKEVLLEVVLPPGTNRRLTKKKRQARAAAVRVAFPEIVSHPLIASFVQRQESDDTMQPHAPYKDRLHRTATAANIRLTYDTQPVRMFGGRIGFRSTVNIAPDDLPTRAVQGHPILTTLTGPIRSRKLQAEQAVAKLYLMTLS